MKLQLARGVRDFKPEEKIVMDEVVDTLKKVFEVYGFVPIETPALERLDVLASKYAGGAEILKEIFKLKDQGNRDLALRYDLTVPFARFVGMNPDLKMPFKRYQIGTVFRDGPIKLGRYREFWQCDVDIVGASSMAADAEIITLTSFAFEKLGLDVVIKYNDRKLLDSLLEKAGVEKEKTEAVILSLDKLDKIGEDGVKKELEEKGIGEDVTEKIFENINNKDIQKNEELKQLEEYIKKFNVKNAEFSPSLARGLSYYTGTVFEVFLTKGEIKSALAAGGRYDNMIGSLVNDSRSYPAVGISFGLDIIMDALKNKKKRKTTTKLYIIPIKTLEKSIGFSTRFRDAGINVDIDLNEKGISRNLDYANALGIPFVLFVGEKELKENKVKLRDMKTGKEELMKIEEVVKRFLLVS